jgi:cytochrome c oxidase cbb3-type subunit 2
MMAFNIWMTIAFRRGAPERGNRWSALPLSRPSKELYPCLSGFEARHLRKELAPPRLIGVLIVIAIGGLVEIVPLFYLKSTIEKVEGVRPYTPLELAGRNIYVREGCYNCHSQMIRPTARRGRALRSRTRWPPRACTTGRSSGGRSAPGRTSPASAASIPTNGTSDHLHVAEIGRARHGHAGLSHGSRAASFSTTRYIDEDLKVQAVLGVPYTPEMIANAR